MGERRDKQEERREKEKSGIEGNEKDRNYITLRRNTKNPIIHGETFTGNNQTRELMIDKTEHREMRKQGRNET